MKRQAAKFLQASLATAAARARRQARRPNRRFDGGWTILELMIVIIIMMILMAIAVPMYREHVQQAREAVLKQNLSQLNSLIEQYKLDKGQAPQSLDDLVNAHYLSKLPADPMTGKADWTTDQEDPDDAVDPNQPGITRVHSAFSGTAMDGEAYSNW